MNQAGFATAEEAVENFRRFARATTWEMDDLVRITTTDDGRFALRFGAREGFLEFRRKHKQLIGMGA